jgi:hypothetical protein
MKRIIALALMVILVISLVPSLIACKRVDESEAKEIVKDLVEQSYELNVIYFGAGLKHDEKSEEGYIRVSDDALYTKKKPLVDKTKEIFSESYAQGIISSAFVGNSGGIDSTAAYARYVEDFDGVLTIRRDSAVIEEIAEYDFSTTKIIKNAKNSIIARITTNNLESNTEVQIQFVYEDGAWKIDSATY